MILFVIFLAGWVIAAIDKHWFADELKPLPHFQFAT
jgi:hypothetical protein